MANRLRFHLDENVNSAVGSALRLAGADVSTTASAGLIGLSDDDQFAYIQREGRVLVTHDDDFLKIVSIRSDHPGIAYSRKDQRSIGEMVEQLILMYEILAPEEMTGQVQYL
jgi:predicted nuclease of predicted toxin-antitoxin system